MPVFAAGFAFSPPLWPVVCSSCTPETVPEKTMPVDRRKSPRLRLAIPVFLRNTPAEKPAWLDFASAVDVSAGGMLLASRRSCGLASNLLLEIPAAPLAGLAELPVGSRCFRGTVVRSLAAEGYHLIAVRFLPPRKQSRKRKPARYKSRPHTEFAR